MAAIALCREGPSILLVKTRELRETRTGRSCRRGCWRPWLSVTSTFDASRPACMSGEELDRKSTHRQTSHTRCSVGCRKGCRGCALDRVQQWLDCGKWKGFGVCNEAPDWLAAPSPTTCIQLSPGEGGAGAEPGPFSPRIGPVAQCRPSLAGLPGSPAPRLSVSPSARKSTPGLAAVLSRPRTGTRPPVFDHLVNSSRQRRGVTRPRGTSHCDI